MFKEDYVISTDSSADFTLEDAKRLGVEVIYFEVSLDGKLYKKESDIKPEKFYKDIEKKYIVPKTTQISFLRYKEHFDSFLKKGKCVLHISFSSGLSGTYSQALSAARELNSVYSERKVLVVDSLCASVGQGLLVHYACMKKKHEKINFQELFHWVSETRFKANHFFTVNDLFYLKKGGRISSTTAIVGSVLSIKPILTIDAQGKISISSKVRGTRAAINNIVKNIESRLTVSKDFGKIIVAHTHNTVFANELKDEIKKAVNITDISTRYIGPSVGSHLGPGAIAAAFFGSDRRSDL